jgi:hypothetical protein
MKTSPRSSTTWILGALACVALSACMTDTGESDETRDGDNVVFVQEAKTMALMVEDSAAPGLVPDTATDPKTLEKIVVPLHYDSSCGCYVRLRQFTNTNKGFGRSRADSIWLYNDGASIVDSFLPERADSIVHVRRVIRIDGHSGKDVNFTARTTLVRRDTDSGMMYFWSGTVSGIFKGRELAGSTFNLTRSFSLSNGFGKPAGSLFVKRGPHDLVYVLHADGTTTCTVMKNGKKVRTEHRDANDDDI